MEQKLGRIPAILLTLGLAVAGFFMEQNLVAQAAAAGGRYGVEAGGKLGWLSLGALVVFALCSALLQPRSQESAVQDRSLGAMVLTLAAAVLMAVGCVLLVLHLELMTDLLVATCGLLTAMIWVVVALDRRKGSKVPALLYMVPTLCYAVELISNFRFWSRDPQILDYCFDLLALICVMCATFHLGGFCFDKGKRRITCFFCCAGIFFSATALAGGDPRSIALNTASILWLFVNLLAILRPQPKKKRAQRQGTGNR